MWLYLQVKTQILILFFIGSVLAHDGNHQSLNPYISPGLQIGYNTNKGLSISYQITIGIGFKIGLHFEDTFPLFLGRTLGVRRNYQKSKPVVKYKYFDNQLSIMLAGFGRGKLINSKGESFKKHKYWIGGFGLLTYDKVFFTNEIEKQYGFFGVAPIPLFLPQ